MRPSSDQRGRLEEIRDNLHDRIAEAEREGWLGEIQGLKVSLAGTEDKLAQIDASLQRREQAVHLGMPAFRDIAGRFVAASHGRNPVTTVNPRHLGDALQACARGIYPLEAGARLLIECGSWLHRKDFTSRFITVGTSISDGTTLLASTDWEAAVTALHAGDLPASGGERRMLLLASSLAGGTPVSLNDTLVGIDRRNASLVVSSVAHAAGLPDPYQETDKQ